jgi:HNH endonuclease
VVDAALKALIEEVTAKRPRTVLDHILKHGYITTAELKDTYGYNHPPRAARDVREQGIPLETFQVTGPDGRSIAAYRLGKPEAATAGRVGGRRAFPKAFKDALAAKEGERCAICGWHFPPRALQIDHRVPYEVAGEAAGLDDLDAYMLVCGSDNRAKSWSCEHCQNWTTIKDPDLCRGCMWATPDDYSHIALEQRRSLVISWQADDVARYDELAAEAEAGGMSPSDYARDILKRSIKQRS